MALYNIEYSWKDIRKITLIIVCGISSDNELIPLCDEVYGIYSLQFEEVNIFFFNSNDNARDYIYRRFVLEKLGEKEIEKSHCVGHLLKNKLIGRFSPPVLLKIYDQPLFKAKSESLN